MSTEIVKITRLQRMTELRDETLTSRDELFRQANREHPGSQEREQFAVKAREQDDIACNINGRMFEARAEARREFPHIMCD